MTVERKNKSNQIKSNSRKFHPKLCKGKQKLVKGIIATLYLDTMNLEPNISVIFGLDNYSHSIVAAVGCKFKQKNTQLFLMKHKSV